MKRPERYVWEDGSTHRAVAGKEYDEVWDYVEQLEKALKYCQDDKVVMRNETDVLKRDLSDSSAQIILDNDTIQRLQAELAAHKENEGDECPLCACEEERDALVRASLSLLMLIGALGGEWTLDNAGPDRKQLAELVNYPEATRKEIEGGE